MSQSEYMKEAGRLADAYAVAYMDFVRCGKSCHEEARAALIAHIQRDAGYARGCKEAEINADSRGMFVARLENMQRQGDRLTAQEVLALLNDCDMLATRDCSALRGKVKP